MQEKSPLVCTFRTAIKLEIELKVVNSSAIALEKLKIIVQAATALRESV
jgi:hypothetical protein